MQAPSSRRASRSAGSSATKARPGVATLASLRLGSRSSTRLDSSGLQRFGDDHSRSVSYRLDTPTPPAVARLRRRLVSASDGATASEPQSGNARPMWGPAGTLPQRCRRVAIPTDPTRQETPDTFGTRSVPIGLATQHDGSRRHTMETPKGLLGARNLARVTIGNVRPRRGFSAHRGCFHPCCGTVCKAPHDGTELDRFTNHANRSSPSPLTRLARRPRRKRRRRPPRVRPQTGHDRSTT